MPNISPNPLKGAIVSLDPNIGFPLGIVTFQYNPDEVTRSLKPQSVATVPLSRWEATGISGDVSFKVQFPGPKTPDFTVMPATKAP